MAWVSAVKPARSMKATVGGLRLSASPRPASQRISCTRMTTLSKTASSSMRRCSRKSARKPSRCNCSRISAPRSSMSRREMPEASMRSSTSPRKRSRIVSTLRRTDCPKIRSTRARASSLRPKARAAAMSDISSISSSRSGWSRCRAGRPTALRSRVALAASRSSEASKSSLPLIDRETGSNISWPAKSSDNRSSAIAVARTLASRPASRRASESRTRLISAVPKDPFDGVMMPSSTRLAMSLTPQPVSCASSVTDTVAMEPFPQQGSMAVTLGGRLADGKGTFALRYSVIFVEGGVEIASRSSDRTMETSPRTMTTTRTIIFTRPSNGRNWMSQMTRPQIRIVTMAWVRTVMIMEFPRN
ncbi:hypothetical protein CHELA1G11_10542 [Hyphomicrobiales bacterium]|nr:hypothetical protein CHELA1G11_10542 [Hyphomicrobiales bacterium]CAH1673936.1 hypothetical protein CHELA1G2_13760 [Hyphomicrobiales bacterium]